MVQKKRLSKRTPTKTQNTIRKKIDKQNKEKRRQERKQLRRQDALPYHKLKSEEELQTLIQIRENAERRQRKYEEKKLAGEETDTQTDDYSKKYLKQIYKLVNESDVIIQVLDARDPLGSRAPEIERIIKENNKKLVLLLNKIDLVDRENWTCWLTYLRQYAPTIPFKASTQSQRTNLGQSEKTEMKAEAYGAKDLLGLLKNYARGGISIVVGIVGCPNVGKSSIINSLKRERSCKVQNTPGVTKTLQKLVLDSSIQLIDSPGVIYKKGNPISEALRATTSDIDPEKIVALIYSKISPSILARLYDIQEPTSEDDLVTQLAVKWGRIGKKATLDKRSTGFTLLRDLQLGKIRFTTRPPQEPPQDILPEGTESLIELTISPKHLSQLSIPEQTVYEPMPLQ
ncbi:nuclear GTP-binding protein [Nematocida sp. AWRm80]|nr:nuclear GTP-binding protein [Nematocida sp. AWRm80]